MKIRRDFITNSSSASFTLVIRYPNIEDWSNESNTKEWLKKSFFCSDEEVNEIECKKDERGGIETITGECICFNSYEDVPRAMREIILASLDSDYGYRNWELVSFTSNRNG